MRRAVSHVRGLPLDVLVHQIRDGEIMSESQAGNRPRALALQRQLIGELTREHRIWRMTHHCRLARFLTRAGDVGEARVALDECTPIQYESARRSDARATDHAWWSYLVARTEGELAQAQGRYVEAERAFRRAVAALTGSTQVYSRIESLYVQVQLANAIGDQGRLLLAEHEARATLQDAVRALGRNSPITAFAVGGLAGLLAGQGRLAESETLRRAVLDIYEKSGFGADSHETAGARQMLGAVLVTQRRWHEGLAEYQRARRDLGDEFAAFQASRGGRVERVLTWPVALVKTGDPDQALELLQADLERSRRLLGDAHRTTARVRGLIAMALARKEERARALAEFSAVLPGLLEAEGSAGEIGAMTTRRWYRDLILEAYIELLIEIRGTSLESAVPGGVVAEAFRMAEATRGGTVQRALSANAARAAARDASLADLVRREQDAGRQAHALETQLADALDFSATARNPKAVADLRNRIETLRRARETLAAQIARGFPGYAQLMDPAPPTLDQARNVLRPGEAWVVTYSNAERTLIWAIPRTGPAAFAVAPIGLEALATEVAALRKALDPAARTVGDIPPFDLARAHRLFQTGPCGVGGRGHPARGRRWRAHAAALRPAADGGGGRAG
jgi:tetratricopeptide (TPR) repeat protein